MGVYLVCHPEAKERNPSHGGRRRGSWKATASAMASAPEQVADPQMNEGSQSAKTRAQLPFVI